MLINYKDDNWWNLTKLKKKLRLNYYAIKINSYALIKFMCAKLSSLCCHLVVLSLNSFLPIFCCRHMGSLNSMRYGSLVKAIYNFTKVHQNYGKKGLVGIYSIANVLILYLCLWVAILITWWIFPWCLHFCDVASVNWS